MKVIVSVWALTVLLISQDVKRRVIFFGDSITEAGMRPGGYITRVADLAAKENRAGEFDFMASGIGGNKVYDLYLRLEDDLLSRNPDVVVIYIGVNDVWHKQSLGTGTDYDKFGKFYSALIAKIKAKNCKIILATPATVGEKVYFGNEILNVDLNRYSALIRKLAEQNKLPLVDLRKAFLDYNRLNNLENKEFGILTTDKVHLNDKGNELVAAEMWKAIKGL